MPPLGCTKHWIVSASTKRWAFDRESLRFLHGLARHGGSPRRRLKPGTVLLRDYQGQRHTVTVVTDGFDWQGATYPSLSAIARAITGIAPDHAQVAELAAVRTDARYVNRRMRGRHQADVLDGNQTLSTRPRS
jgi:hypothetical protein